jgi:two-component system sensor histidine kinase RegB
MGGRGAEPAGEMPARVSLQEICNQVRSDLAGGKSEFVRIEVESGATTFLPAGAVRQALLALVKNALDASAPGRIVTLTAQSEPGNIRFIVQDSGCGMSPETLNRIAEPFFTTKGTGEGLGLGTFLARLFAERMNGSLAFESELGIGTKAILELPRTHYDGKG